MGLFRRSKKSSDLDVGHVRKQSTYDVHDPILTAIRDEEPFQASNHHGAQQHVGTLSPDMHLRDVFGNPIDKPDLSNPSRPRNERPLDTIRAFEYACTGDERLRDEMETPRLGWTTRNGFPGGGHYAYGGRHGSMSAMMPKFETNLYAQASSAPASSNVITFDSPNNTSSTAVDEPVKKKKKRGLFGRHK